MPRRSGAPPDLEALDPVTGEALSPPDEPQPHASRRAAWLRRTAVLLVLLSLTSAIGATYVGTTVSSLRKIERSWRVAMAIDAQRGAVDARIHETAREFGEPEDNFTSRPLELIGREEDGHLERLQKELDKHVVPDGGVRRLRDAMVEALEFRRLQLQPSRIDIGDTPLRRVDEQLEKQLDRWRISARPVATGVPQLKSADDVLAKIARFADTTVNTTLIAVTGSQISRIDIDKSEIEMTQLDTHVIDLVALDANTVVTVDGASAIARRTDNLPSVAWQQPAEHAVRSVDGRSLWLQTPDGAKEVAADGALRGATVRMPANLRLFAEINSGLVLGQQPAGPLQLWDPTSGTKLRDLSDDARFIAAAPDRVAFEAAASQVLRLETATGTVVRELDLPRTDAGRGAFSPQGGMLAFPAGPAAGDRAVIVRHNQYQGHLLGLRGPSTTLAVPPVWSPSGEYLFWVTRDGRIAIHRAGTDRASLLRVSLRGVRFIAALPDR